MLIEIDTDDIAQATNNQRPKGQLECPGKPNLRMTFAKFVDFEVEVEIKFADFMVIISISPPSRRSK